MNATLPDQSVEVPGGWAAEFAGVIQFGVSPLPVTHRDLEIFVGYILQETTLLSDLITFAEF
jgi:hypothetical protein